MKLIKKTWNKYFGDPAPIIITDKKKIRSYHLSRLLPLLSLLIAIVGIIISIVRFA